MSCLLSALVPVRSDGLQIDLRAEAIRGLIELDQAEVQIELYPDGELDVHLGGERLKLPAIPGLPELRGWTARCRWHPPAPGAKDFSCQHGRLQWQVSAEDPRRLTAEFTLQAHADTGRVSLGLVLPELGLAHLHAWLGPLAHSSLPSARWPASLTGTADIELAVEADPDGLAALQGRLRLRDLGFSAADAAEHASIALDYRALRTGPDWSGDVQLALSAGALYVVPGYTTPVGAQPGWLWDAREGPVRADVHWQWQAASATLALPEFRFAAPGVDLKASRVRLRPGAPNWLEELSLDLAGTELDRLYRHYLQPALLGSPLGDLQAAGRVALRLDWSTGGLQNATVTFKDVQLKDTRGRFGIAGLDGALALGTAHAGAPSPLAFEQASLYRLPIGPTRLSLAAGPRGFEMHEVAELPILDGAFKLSTLSFTQDAAGPRLMLAGVLTPISLPVLAAQLGWPSAAGKISGVIPAVSWGPRAIEVDGDILVKVFDGRIIARDLSIREPLGTLPELTTDLELHDLDLELMTRETDFGLIQGSLEGRVEDLRLQAWQPLAMDLRLGTPADDQRPHRISQRAVNALSALAGGGPNLLSRGLMRVFNTYSYGRLGLGCRLRNGLCQMSGVYRRPDGALVLVSRGGLLPPYIEVRAAGETLAWTRLADIYQRIRSGELIIE